MKGLIYFGLFICVLTSRAQTNSWTNSVGGNWHDPYWSLGILPRDGQTILFTNAGSKTLLIGPDTVQNFPETLRLYSLTIASEPGSVNTLRFDNIDSTYERLADQVTIGSNSAVELNGSWLRTYDISVGSHFNANDSQLIAHSLRVGDVGPGTFNLTNSMLTMAPGYVVYVGENFPAVFNKHGGTNNSSGVILYRFGEYNFVEGYLKGPIVFMGGQFNQFGGNVAAQLFFYETSSTYTQAGGVLACGNLQIPHSQTGGGGSIGNSFRQTGGTNFAGNIILGGNGGAAQYCLEGGVLMASQVIVRDFIHINPGGGGQGSTFCQSGGFQTNTELYIEGYRSFYGASDDPSYYVLAGGLLSTPSIRLDIGDFTQTGGTNMIGNLALENVSHYRLSAGTLEAQNISASGYWYSRITTFEQTGGTNRVSNILGVNGGSKYDLNGGSLSAQNVYVSASSFNHAGGTALIPGVLMLEAGIWNEQTEEQQFGSLELSAEVWRGSNSFLRLPATPCRIRFGDCSGLIWSNGATLTIEGWFGSLYGGGQHRVIFGDSAAALGAEQLAQIRFHDPAGLPTGYYPARILATGEIVPESGTPFPLIMRLVNSATGLALGVDGEIGEEYEIEVSSNLLDWCVWTNLFNAEGTVWTADPAAQNFPQRFYRARRMR